MGLITELLSTIDSINKNEKLNDHEIVLDILSNDEDSDDKEIVDVILDSTKFKKDKVVKLVKELRPKFLRGDFNPMRSKLSQEDLIDMVKKYLK